MIVLFVISTLLLLTLSGCSDSSNYSMYHNSTQSTVVPIESTTECVDNYTTETEDNKQLEGLPEIPDNFSSFYDADGAPLFGRDSYTATESVEIESTELIEIIFSD